MHLQKQRRKVCFKALSFVLNNTHAGISGLSVDFCSAPWVSPVQEKMQLGSASINDFLLCWHSVSGQAVLVCLSPSVWLWSWARCSCNFGFNSPKMSLEESVGAVGGKGWSGGFTTRCCSRFHWSLGMETSCALFPALGFQTDVLLLSASLSCAQHFLTLTNTVFRDCNWLPRENLFPGTL